MESSRKMDELPPAVLPPSIPSPAGEKAKEKRSKDCPKLMDEGPCLYRVLAHCEGRARALHWHPGCKLPNCPSSCSRGLGWTGGYVLQQWAPIGNSVKCRSQCLGECCCCCKKKDVKSWLAVPPGAVLCGTRDGWVLQGSWQALDHCRHRFTEEASELQPASMLPA